MSLPDNPLDKYIIQKRDGTPLDPQAKYFVVRFDAQAEHGWIARTALAVYCALLEKPGKKSALAEALKAEIDLECFDAWKEFEREGESNG